MVTLSSHRSGVQGARCTAALWNEGGNVFSGRRRHGGWWGKERGGTNIWQFGPCLQPRSTIAGRIIDTPSSVGSVSNFQVCRTAASAHFPRSVFGVAVWGLWDATCGPAQFPHSVFGLPYCLDQINWKGVFWDSSEIQPKPFPRAQAQVTLNAGIELRSNDADGA
ncbi:hypothetical protein B0H14DRAFT_2651432 [Mycena olivaceomarginata]|nr:hypothetical protein B0H14DRAFT_2651432 [Mycena olivaceomarginata]